MTGPVQSVATHGAIAEAVRRFYETERPVGLLAGVYPREQKDYWIFSEGSVSETTAVRPDRQTIWQVGSITKTFTATMLADVASSGLLALNDPVQAYVASNVALPTWQTWQGATPFTFENLATHTAGLPMDAGRIPPGGFSIQQMYEYLGGYTLAVAPGTLWNYSNLGFGLLANTLIYLHDVADYETLVEHLKLRSGLSMPDTRINLTPGQKARRSHGFVRPGVRAAWQTITWPACDGSGALYSSLEDLMVWLGYNLGWSSSPIDHLLPILFRIYFKDPQIAMGLSWEYARLPGTTAGYVSKSGNTNGFTSFIAFDEGRNFGTVVLCNTQSVWPQPLVEEILRLLRASDS